MSRHRVFQMVVSTVAAVAVMLVIASMPTAPARRVTIRSALSLRSVVAHGSTTAARQGAIFGPLQSALANVVAPYGSSCFEVVRGSQVLATSNAALPLIPASTEKLLTTVAALAVLGGDYRYVTRVVIDDPLDVSVPRIWLVGSGDPLLRTADQPLPWVGTPLEPLADALVALGIRHIGQVFGDDSRYDQERFRPGWKPSYRSDFEVGPIGALTVDDGIPARDGQPQIIDDPALYTAARFTDLLRARGVTVDNDAGHAMAPLGSLPITSVTSAPLERILAWMLATSDNTTAELITKELGIGGYALGTTAAGVATIRDVLSQYGVPVAGLVLNDGSGLDRGDRLTCDTLVRALDLATLRRFADVPALLPAVEFTPRLAGHVRAKSGYLSDVTGLAGVIRTTAPFHFAVVLNGNVPRGFPTALGSVLDALATNLPE